MLKVKLVKPGQRSSLNTTPFGVFGSAENLITDRLFKKRASMHASECVRVCMHA